jgi:L-alanine-DL-glutamate epimerase-like enolase superfamily enzyme
MNKTNFSRRSFIQNSALTVAGLPFASSINQITLNHPKTALKPLQITRVNSNFEREPLAKPFGFKGGAITNVWQSIAMLENEAGTQKIGLGVQSVLWSDSKVFAAHSENGGNALMFAMTERALQLIKGRSFDSPIAMLDDVLEEVLEYGRKITGNQELRKTFALNALVAVDNAAWLLYAAENGIDQFDDLIPKVYKDGLSARHQEVASIPALGYGTPIDTIKGLADEGFFIMKIKIGAPGDQDTMLEKDKAFLKAIHDGIGHYKSSYAPNGKIPYYFDANGRYESQDTLHRFLDYAEKIGALDQIAVVEEPFGEHNHSSVASITARGPRVAADESAHTDEDAISRIEQGYNCIALKAVAKTMSMTMKIAQAAYERKVPCFCADLTVNPILVDWNKIVAARLPAFPGWKIGMQETNGWQNYRNWDRMMEHYPMRQSDWVPSKKGVYETGKGFWEKSGGIFAESEYYKELVR